jgi:hypothetical protein
LSSTLEVEQVFNTQPDRGKRCIAESADSFLEPCFVEDTNLIGFGDAILDFAMEQQVFDDFSRRNKDSI